MLIEDFDRKLMETLKHPDQWESDVHNLTHKKTRIFIPLSHLEDGTDIIAYSNRGNQVIVLPVEERAVVNILVKSIHERQQQARAEKIKKVKIEFLKEFKGFG